MIKLLKDFSLSIIINAFILWILDYYNFGISIQFYSADLIQTIIGFIILGFVFWIFNFLIKKILTIVSLPLKIITFGLISIVINIGILYLFVWFVNHNLSHFSIQLGSIYQTLILSFTIFIAYYLLSKLIK